MNHLFVFIDLIPMTNDLRYLDVDDSYPPSIATYVNDL